MEEKPIVDFEIEGDLGAQEALKNASHAISSRATVHVIAQSHLDLMWKWDRHDVREMIYSTFAGHAALLEANPSYTYSQGQLFLYDYVRVHFPDLFERIKALVAGGRWEIVGGQWVEPDGNLPDDESTVRQFLLGQRFALKHFGVAAQTGWCQDAFGTNANMPQVLRGAGLRFYVHKRPRHRFLPLPCTPYLLEGADGTRVCALRSNNKGIGLPRVSEGEPFEGTEIEHIHRKNTELGISDLWGPLGCGDTGGVNDYGDVPSGKHSGLDFRFSTSMAYFDAIQNGPKALPVVRDEINFEFPACYTTHADIKQGNRRCERLLNMAEFVCSIQYLLSGQYPQEELNGLWKLLLYNQFHDGITGTGLDRVHEDTLKDYAHIEYVARELISSAAETVGQSADTSRFERPYIVFNPNYFELNALVRIDATISLPGRSFALVDGGGSEYPGEVVSDELLDGNGNYHRLAMLFPVKGIPPCGWLAMGLERREVPQQKPGIGGDSPNRLENRYYSLTLDNQGQIAELYDKVLSASVNKQGEAFAELQLLGEGNYTLDYGRPHKAWNFGLDGTRHEIEYLGGYVEEDNALRTVLRQRFRFGSSELARDIILHHTMKRLEFRLELDWQETEKYLGVTFPLNLGEDARIYHRIPFALMNRTRTDECPSQNYLTVSDDTKEFALMTEDRYGFSESEKNTVRMSLIRCSTDYENRSDKGRYAFNFAVTSGTADEFETVVRQCEAYRRPAYVFQATRHPGTLPDRFSLLDAGDSPVLVSAIKRLEDGNGLTVRLFNPLDKPCEAHAGFLFRYDSARLADLLEREEAEPEIQYGKLKLSFRKHEFKTIVLKGVKA